MSAVEYAYRASGWKPRGSLTADTVGHELEQIAARSGLQPQAVVDAARPKRAALHPVFEWDDTIAAEEYRRHQARSLVQAIVVKRVDGKPARPVRAFVHLRPDSEEEQYVSILDAREDPVLRQQLLQKAAAELKSWERRYRDLKEFTGLVAAIDSVVEEIRAA